MFGQFKNIESKRVKIATGTINFSNLNFDKNPYHRFKMWMYGAGPLINQPSIRFNGDAGLNYDKSALSINAAGAYTVNPSTGDDKLFIGPGFTSPGEQIIVDVCIVKGAVKTYVSSKVYTNGSLEGDIHFFDGHWNSAADIETVDFLAFDVGLSADGKFGEGVIIQAMTLGSAK